MAPDEYYEQRRRELKLALGRAEAQSRSISRLRLLSFVAAAVTTAIAFDGHGIQWAAGAVASTVGFVALVLYHQGVHAQLHELRMRSEFVEQAIARLSGQWGEHGPTHEPNPPAAHLCSEDLDIFGQNSLFQLICRARTSAGQAHLADWLRKTSKFEDVKERQESVQELRHRPEFIEQMAVLGGRVASGCQLDRVQAWASEGALMKPGPLLRLRLLAFVLPILTLGSMAHLVWNEGSLWVCAGMLGLEAIVVARHRHVLGRLTAGLRQQADELELIGELLQYFYEQSWQSPLLVHIQKLMRYEQGSVDQKLRQLRRRVEGYEALNNGLFAILVFPLMWSSHCLLAIHNWREQHRCTVHAAIVAVGELEALSSLACYSFERPQDIFPELLAQNTPELSARGLRHPLLADAVENDISLGKKPQLLLVSGSNMSGKSTYLRSIGINVVLAQAGAPVRASMMRLSPLRIGATMRIEDSLQAGKSRFYAEVTRLAAIVEAAKDHENGHLLFLFDELFHGTNSHDRRLGAQSLIELMVEQTAIGLVSTHDLELTKIVEQFGPRAKNVHFTDELKDGRLHFDYRRREGVVQRSNALAVLAAAGLTRGQALGQ